ncbi:MAG: ABC transporter substrate-binding protein [Gemmatimonadaceae bacterium]
MSSLRSVVVVAVLAFGCTQPPPARLGSAIPLPPGHVLDVLDTVLSAIPAGERPVIERWSVFLGTSIESAWKQATLYSAQPDIVGVVGHAGSRDALVGATVYNRAGIPQLVPTATSSRLTEVGPWTFVLVPDNRQEGDFLAAYAADSLDARRVTVFYVGDEYGAELRDGITSGLRVRGRDVTDAVLVPDVLCEGVEADLYRAIALASLRRAPPDVVILAVGVAEGGCLVEPIFHELPGVHLLAADGFSPDSPRVRALTADARSRIRYVSFWQPTADSTNRAFLDVTGRVMRRAPRMPEPFIYDAFMLLTAAVRDVGRDREQVRRWLESLGNSRAHFPGVTGPIAFTNQRRAGGMWLVGLESPE